MLNKNEYIRNINKYEIPILQKFIKENYSKKHILVSNKKILNFYYNNLNKKNLNFIGYFKNKRILAILGLITSKNWDINSNKDYFVALGVKHKDLKINVIFKFFIYIYKNINPKLLACSVFNNNVKKIYEKKTYSILF